MNIRFNSRSFAARSVTARYFVALCLAVFCSPTLASTAEPVTPQVVSRVVTLSPQGTELAFAAGLGDFIVGVSEHSDFPYAAQSIERIANHRSINLERVIALNPDIILAWEGGNPEQQLLKLREFGFTVINTYPSSIDDIANVLETLSQYAPSPEQGQNAARDFRRQLDILNQKYSDAEPVRFFYQLSSQPLMTMSPENWPGPVFSVCKGENIFADTLASYPQVSLEQVLVRQPEVIFTPENGSDSLWQQWQGQIPAVDNQHIYALNSDWLNRATPRSLMAIVQVCNYLDSVREKQF
uniref:vitamin B12 ABC transporter substrate-binding protein BtuF n=1 Tax=Thaumasiovibrio occultus TaxID=1891184 RepID=UPI000B3599D6|nr:vitamin B12 ABC transporter substrate-binding protein BtuF [Thaumasiovibrio occultus]